MPSIEDPFWSGMMYDTLISILEESVRRNGEKPLTNRWLLNIIKMADRAEYINSVNKWQEQDVWPPSDWD